MIDPFKVYNTLTDAELTFVQSLAGLADPNADAALFWDDSESAHAYLTFGDGLSVSTTTLSVDINGLTEEAAFTSGDFVMFYDTTAGALRKVNYDDLPGSSGATISGTPVDNQVAIWASATALEGDAALTFDTTTDTLGGMAVINGAAAGLTISTSTNGNITIDPGGSGTATLNAGSGGVTISTDAGNSNITLSPHGTGVVNLAASTDLAFNGTAILSDSAGTMTLSNVDAVDATTQATIEDVVGGMLTGNTETLITVTYQAADNTIDFVVDNDLANYSNTNSQFLTAITGESIGSLSDVTLTTLGTDELLFTQDGSTWINQTLAEAGIQAQGDVLDDLITLGTVASDGQFIVGTGAGAFAYESGSTARTSLGLGAVATLGVTGADTNAVTGTAGTSGNLAQWNADGDLVDASVATANIYSAGGTDVALADGGTGASLTDPNADRILFWDDSAGAVTWLTAGTGLSITTTTIAVSGLTTSEISASTLVTAADTIASNDNDTTIPTSAAVIDYVAANAGADVRTYDCVIPVDANTPVYHDGTDIALTNAGAAGTTRFIGFTTAGFIAPLDYEEVNSATYSYTLPAGTNRCLMVSTVDNSGGTSATASWDGNALTTIANQTGDNEYCYAGYYMVGTSASDTTANITLSGNWDRALVIVYEDVDQSTGIGTTNSASVARTASLSLTPSVSGSRIVWFGGTNNVTGTVAFALTGCTQLLNVNNWNIVAEEASFSTSSVSATAGGSNYGTCAMIGVELIAPTGSTVDVQTTGVLSGFTGLTVGEEYYLTDTDGGYGTTAGTNTLLIGKALSTTEMLIVH